MLNYKNKPELFVNVYIAEVCMSVSVVFTGYSFWDV